MTLPPGQRRVDGFPRFGTHFARPAPPVPEDPAIEVGGAVDEPFRVPLSTLAELPRREITADLHCVAGWSAIELRWEGVPFEVFYRTVVAPHVQAEESVTHVVFTGLDEYSSIATIEDALAEDVLLAEHLDGRPLDTDHGAPVRLVSPSQYGFVSTKHLCRIELHSDEPAAAFHSSRLRDVGLHFVWPHPRARVWHEERHRYVPGRLLRPVYRLLIPPIRTLSARGSARRR